HRLGLPARLLFLVPAPVDGGGPGAAPAAGPEGEEGDADPQGDGAREEGQPAVPECFAPGEVRRRDGEGRPRRLPEGLLEGYAAGDPGEDGCRRSGAPAGEDLLDEGEGEGVG